MIFFKKKRARLEYLLPIMVLIAMVSAGVGPASGAEKYPAKAVTIIVPFAPGGGVDLTARVVAYFLAKEWDQPVNVVNKEGGNTVIGTLEMMKSKPDGYTVLADNPSSACFQVILPDLPFKIEARTSLATATAGPMVYAANSKAPWMNLKDVAAAAKKNPENFRWGSLGGVSVADFALQQFFADAGIDLPQTKTVRFKGAGDAIIALAGGHIDFTSVGVPAVLSYTQSGMVRVVGVTGPAKDFPDVKTGAAQGFPGITAMTWQGYSGPPGVPKSVITVWEQTLEKVTKLPEFKARTEKIGYVPFFMKSEDWKRLILKETDDVRKLFRVKGK